MNIIPAASTKSFNTLICWLKVERYTFSIWFRNHFSENTLSKHATCQNSASPAKNGRRHVIFVSPHYVTSGKGIVTLAFVLDIRYVTSSIFLMHRTENRFNWFTRLDRFCARTPTSAQFNAIDSNISTILLGPSDKAKSSVEYQRSEKLCFAFVPIAACALPQS